MHSEAEVQKFSLKVRNVDILRVHDQSVISKSSQKGHSVVCQLDWAIDKLRSGAITNWNAIGAVEEIGE